MLRQSIRHAGTPPGSGACLIGLHNSHCRLHIYTEYRRVLPRYPIPDRAKNGVFCNVTASAPPRVGKTVGCRIILWPDIAGMTHLYSGKRRNLAQKRSLQTSEGHHWRCRIVCSQLELQNIPKNARRIPGDPLPHGRKQALGILQMHSRGNHV